MPVTIQTMPPWACAKKGRSEPVSIEILGLITVAIGVLILANWVDRRR